MGKIRVRDIAQRIGVPEQDLLFKLKAIGVRVEGEDGLVDTELIQAILQGKKLPQPQREVIVRDGESAPQQPAPQRRPPARRQPPPTGQLRPTRRRSVVNKGEQIRTLPSTEPKRPAHTETPTASPEQQVAAAAPAPQTRPAARPAGPAGPAARPATPRRPAAAERQPARAKKASRAERVAEIEAREDLSQFRGDVSELDAAEETAAAEAAAAAAHHATTPSGRRNRRAERRREADAADEQGTLLSSRELSEGPITISEGLRVRDLAEKLGIKTKDLIRALIKRGIMATVNHVVDPELAVEMAEELGFEAMIVTFEEEVQLQRPPASEGTEERPPVVTIMGHVDHGKTTLLDTIRSSKITAGESGGITQHIGAYAVEANGKKIVFLDTPGHEAFTQLRARGASATDVVVLVVAADDGVMPQTREAINHAKAADVPIIVAINKIDRANANPDRVKKDLADNDLLVEDWGGDVVCAEVSALEGLGIDELLELILLQAELLELKADSKLPAQGIVLEARKEAGRGTVATVLVQNGTLSVGDVFVSGATHGKVRLMVDDKGERIDSCGPATPVEVSGFQDIPNAGDSFQVVEEESKARQIAGHRQEEQRARELAPTAGRLSLESLFESLEQGHVKELPIVIKADVQGSVEVLRDTLQKLSTDRVKVKVIHSGVGAITTNDVLLASASGAIIYGFSVRPERKATELADKEEIDIRTHTVIYELVDELKKAMAGLLDPTYKEVEQGRAEVREIFSVPKIGTIAGCHVVEGVILRNSKIRLLRDNVVVHEGRVGSLRRFKDDAAEVRSGFDCGIGIEGYQDLKPGDMIEAYTEEAVAATL